MKMVEYQDCLNNNLAVYYQALRSGKHEVREASTVLHNKLIAALESDGFQAQMLTRLSGRSSYRVFQKDTEERNG